MEQLCNGRLVRRVLKDSIRRRLRERWQARTQATFSAARSKSSDYIPPPPTARTLSAQSPAVTRCLSRWRRPNVRPRSDCSNNPEGNRSPGYRLIAASVNYKPKFQWDAKNLICGSARTNAMSVLSPTARWTRLNMDREQSQGLQENQHQFSQRYVMALEPSPLRPEHI